MKRFSLLKKVFFRQYPGYYFVSLVLADLDDTKLVDKYVKIYSADYIVKRYDMKFWDLDKLKIIEALLISKDKRGVNLAADLFYNCKNIYYQENILKIFQKYTNIT